MQNYGHRADDPFFGTVLSQKGASSLTLYIHPEGAPITFKTTGPFYVGIGFTSHLPANVLTAKVTDVVMENASGKIR